MAIKSYIAENEEYLKSLDAEDAKEVSRKIETMKVIYNKLFDYPLIEIMPIRVEKIAV